MTEANKSLLSEGLSSSSSEELSRVVLKLVTELNESDSAGLDTQNEDVVKSSSPTTNDERRRQVIAQQAHLARDVANTTRTVGLIEWKNNKRPGDGSISSSLIKKISHKDDMLSWALTGGGLIRQEETDSGPASAATSFGHLSVE
jgi:hypothetical protein